MDERAATDGTVAMVATALKVVRAAKVATVVIPFQLPLGSTLRDTWPRL